MQYPLIFQNLIDSFKKLPGVGAKTAERMAYDVLNMSKENIEQFATSILSINNISRCPICGNLSENNENCELCDSEERDHKTICVVHGPKDVFAFEKMKEYHGVYHVLNGYISPSKGIGYDDINLPSLIQRIKDENCLICFGLSACLDGLQQLGANHTVPVAKDKLDKYLNQQAHE